METIRGPELESAARRGTLRLIRAVETGEGKYQLVAFMVGSDVEATLVTTRKDVREWAQFNTLARYVRDEVYPRGSPIPLIEVQLLAAAPAPAAGATGDSAA